MALGSGTRLGRYEIRSQIGAGGMGEVYLAHDTQLDRPIALKILTADVARDQQRLHRFLQEARAASALSHPNVAHIYEIGEGDGAHFIAMEFVEGASLDKKIDGQPLHMSELLDIAIQIADALDEAHAKGVTHRDIKSSNIMITPRGRVKVLDFGLAKLSLPSNVTDRTSNSEVATRVKTSPGVVMGTVNYMSPEQALGREVDHRSDIFSFGVVLYEMATGRVPFAGETITETIDRIAHAQPEAIARLNYDVPAEFEIIVKKALRKDRNERYQTIHDLLVDLKDLRRELDISARLEHSVAPSIPSAEISAPTVTYPSSSRTISPVTTTPTPAVHPTSSAEYLVSEIKRHKTGLIVIAACALVILTGGGLGIYKLVATRNQTTKPAGASILPNMKIQRLTSNGNALEAAISPDGKWVVYVRKDGDQRSLHVHQIATGSDVQIIPPADARVGRATFSADGNYIYYPLIDQNDPGGALYQAPSLGGAPRKLLTNISSPITFSPDGKQIAFYRDDEAGSHEDQIIVANTDGTGERKLAVRKDDKWFERGGCDWSPDGKTIACPGGAYGGGLHETVIAVDVATGNQTEFVTQKFGEAGSVAWLVDGTGIVVSASEVGLSFHQLWLLSYPGGEARRITTDLNDYTTPSFTADTKTLATVQNDETSNIWIAPVTDVEQGRQITTGKLDGTLGIAWTPDGRIVYTVNANGISDIWIMNADGSNQRPLTNDPHEDYRPIVTADGRYIVFTSDRGGFPNIWRMNLDGGNLKQLTQGQEDYATSISPDSRWIIFDSWRTGRRTPWKMSIDGAEPTQIMDKFTSDPIISPEGKLIAFFFRDEQPGSPWRLMVAPFEGGEAPTKTFETIAPVDFSSVDTGIQWAPDGRSIQYVNSRDGTNNLIRQPIDGSAPEQITKFKANGIGRFAFSRDGKTIAFVRSSTRSDVVLIRDFR